ncbi:DUF397 domain-containing protein [Nocardia bovistercoris]|uniref:DUF397 domain-containing protein n=1 Tax=Nocardia bovistercoris TaxID=2785916 RepID=A0A931IGQ0_9NOCA|nr:DUF397 domain-containing protein [Nocardia bovistercoris]MBH0781224.1 DUF397 domain-containing protein [Nocardia bovistercoris]
MTTTATLRSVCTGWFTSTKSNNGNQCVEVRFVGDAVLIRDSKYRRDPANRPGDEPIITVTANEWTLFLGLLTTGRPADRLIARTGADGTTTLRHGHTTLTYTPEEWDAFVAGVHDGEFDRATLSV